MQTGPFEALLLSAPDVIPKWRKIIGNTKYLSAHDIYPYSFRAKYGLSDTRNGFHGADSEISVEKEAKLLGMKIKPFLDTLDFEFEFIPELGVHKPVFKTGGFCKDVSTTLGLKSTWNRVYDSDFTPKEWFEAEKTGDVLKDWLDQSTAKKILDIGCGKSTLCNELAAKYPEKSITACDFAENLIKSRQAEISENLKFQCIDLVKDDIPKTELVIDKATIDAIIRQENGDEIGKNVIEKLIAAGMKTMIMISDEEPNVRYDLIKSMFMNEPTIIFESLDDTDNYFAYKISI